MAKAQIEPTKAPQVVFDARCSECGGEIYLPLYKIMTESFYAGNRIIAEWMFKEGLDDYCRVACAQCGAVGVIKKEGHFVYSGRKLFGAADKKVGKKAKGK